MNSLTPPSLSQIFATLLNLATTNNRHVDVAQLTGRRLIIAIDELPQDIAVTVRDKRFYALSDDDAVQQADVTISGNLKAILTMIQNKDSDLQSDELYIAGKISVAKDFQHFLASLTIDWQGFFGQLLPGTIANKVGSAVEQGLHFARGSTEQLAESLKRYLIEDKKIFVTRHEFTQWQVQINDFNQRVNRLLTALHSTAK